MRITWSGIMIVASVTMKRKFFPQKLYLASAYAAIELTISVNSIDAYRQLYGGVCASQIQFLRKELPLHRNPGYDHDSAPSDPHSRLSGDSATWTHALAVGNDHPGSRISHRCLPSSAVHAYNPRRAH